MPTDPVVAVTVEETWRLHNRPANDGLGPCSCPVCVTVNPEPHKEPQMGRPQAGPLNANWRGGRVEKGNGYTALFLPEHPHAHRRGYALEHLVVASKALGKPLPPRAEVHHVDGQRSNNDPHNLVICEDHAYHCLLHLRADALRATGNANARRCEKCGAWEEPTRLSFAKGKTPNGVLRAYHRDCNGETIIGRRWNPGGIPDSIVLPDGATIFEIESLEETESRGGKMMFKGRLSVVEGPPGSTGLTYFENFVMGTDDDPTWRDPATVGPGARNLKNMLKACGVDISNEDLDECIAEAQGQQVGGVVERIVDDGKADPKYKGQERNRVSKWFAPGEREIGGPAKPAAKPAPAPAAKPQPARTAAPTPAAKPAAKAAAGGPAKVKCSLCGNMIERAAFADHVASCEGNTDE